jgi:hypothetical protein
MSTANSLLIHVRKKINADIIITFMEPRSNEGTNNETETLRQTIIFLYKVTKVK